MEDYFETFFDPTRKEHKKEQRIASKADRSKYKTSNIQKKITKALPKASETLFEGRVLSIRSQEIEVFIYPNKLKNRKFSDAECSRFESEKTGLLLDIEAVFSGSKMECSAQEKTDSSTCLGISSGKIICTLKGSLKEEKHHHKNLIIVGDLVLLELIGNKEGFIHHILPRTSVLSRQDNLRRIKNQLVAANVDQVLITTSLGNPSFRPSIIDRYLVAAEKGNLHPTIVINKIDLCTSHAKEASLVEESVSLYKKLGFPIVCVSALTGEGMDELRTLLKGKTSVFSGQSGTGKTHLVNCMTGLSLHTQAVRSGGKGSHTTTSAKLLELPFGGWCIDTPGIRSFGIWDFKQEDLTLVFREISEASEKCFFANCKHQPGESGCFIEQAIKDGLISPVRYASYLSLLSSLQENKEWYS